MATAADRYSVEKARCKGLLKTIAEKLDEHTPTGYDTHWGHVGDMTEVWRKLKAINDFLSTEEE